MHVIGAIETSVLTCRFLLSHKPLRIVPVLVPVTVARVAVAVVEVLLWQWKRR